MKQNTRWLGVFLGLFAAVGPLRGDSPALRQALYHHQLDFCQESSSSAGQQPVTSRIFPDSRLADAKTAATYSESVDAKEFDKPFTASHLSPDGKNGDTFKITLHRTNKPDQARAEFEHTVYNEGEVELRFSGVTRVPMCVTPPALTAAAAQEMKTLQDFFASLKYGSRIQITFRDGRTTTVKLHSYDPHKGVAWVQPLEKGWFNARAVRLDDLSEAHKN
jgi:hypothetical protein